MAFAWVLYWGNFENPDYYNYLRIYDTSGNSNLFFTGLDFQIGFIALVKLANQLGLSYGIFLSILVTVSFLLIHSTVRTFSTNYNYVYILYFIFPFFFDVVQVKNFLAMSIFVFSIKYLVYSKPYGKIIYISLILLAGSIHYSALLYLPFLLINTKNKNQLPKYIAIFAVLTSIVILLNGKQVPFISDSFIQLLDSEKVENWLDKRTNFGFILFWFLQVSSFWLVKYSKNIYLSNKIYANGNDKRKDKYYLFINLVYWVNIVAFIFFPLYLFASTFTRLMRNIVLLNYIVFSITNSTIRKPNQKIQYGLGVFLYIFIFFIIMLFPEFEEVILPIMQNNFILG